MIIKGGQGRSAASPEHDAWTFGWLAAVTENHGTVTKNHSGGTVTENYGTVNGKNSRAKR